jgi:fibronectin-binding autotransporter adhesin
MTPSSPSSWLRPQLGPPARLPRRVGQALCGLVLAAWSPAAWAQLTWTAQTNTTWDGESVNWRNSEGSDVVYAGTSAVFNDTAPADKRTITVSGSQTVQTLNVSAAVYVFNGGTLASSAVNPVWTINSELTINSAITGSHNIRKQGSGTLTTTGNITLSSATDGLISVIGGTFRQTSGTITLGRSSAGSAALFVGNGVGGVFESTGGTLRATGTTQPGSLMVGLNATGTLTVNGGSLGFAGSANVFNTGTGRTGTINLQAGSLALNNLTVSTGTAAFNFSGGTLRPYSTDATIGSGTPEANFSIGLTGTGATISGIDFDPITPVPRSLDLYATLTDGGSAGGVTFSGGTVTVRAANTYTGSTAIAANTTVALLGSAASSSGFAVNGTLDVSGQTSGFAFGSGQTVSGTGTIALPATGPGVSLAGFLAPGNSAIGTLAFGGSGTLDLEPALAAGSGRLQFELAAPGTSDLVTVSSGTLAIGAELLGFADFDFTTLAGFGPGTYTLFSASTLLGSLGAATTGSLGGFDATLEQSGGTIHLVVVPEPGSLLLAAMALAAAAWARGRRGGRVSA